MAKRLSAAVGVDIGTQSIKVATVRGTKDGAAITGLGTVATPEGTVDHTGIFDPQTIGQALKGVVATVGGGVRDVVFCLSGQSAVVVRILEVPKMSDSELSDHMQWEIQRNIPFAETNVVSDFRPIDNPAMAAGQNMEVVMAVSPRSAVETVMTLIRAAGCKAGAIDVEPLGLARVLKTCHYNDLGNANTCLVHMGHSTTSINMYRSGVLAFPRTIPMGGSTFTKAIAESMGLSIEEAEGRKVTSAAIPESATSGGAVGGVTMQAYNPFSDAGDDQSAAPAAAGGDADRVWNAVSASVEEFVAEIRRSIDYFRSRGGDVSEIGISGGGAKFKGLGGYLSRALGLPVTAVDPTQGLQLGGPGSETYGNGNASEFAVAVGMGLHIAYD